MTTRCLPQPQSDQDLLALQHACADWLLPGFVARGNVTLLTSLWKAGKTTLLTLLLARRARGGELAGLPVAPGKSIVVSEEPQPFWTERARRHDFGGKSWFFCRPFNHVPSLAEWRGLLERIGQLRLETDADLLVVDTLSHFLRAENNGAAVLDTLMPLAELTAPTATAPGMAVLLLHHPGKRSAAALGRSARGHGGLLGHVDISIEMRCAGNDPASRVRRLYSESRHADTPRHFLMELSADGNDYLRLPETDDDGFQRHWDVLRMVLEDAPQKLTRDDILDEWPDDFDTPERSTLWRWLTRAVADDLIQVEGSGRKSDPFRYWLPAAEARWKEDILYDVMERQTRELKLPFRSLRDRKRWAAEEAAEDRLFDPSRIWPPGSPLE